MYDGVRRDSSTETCAPCEMFRPPALVELNAIPTPTTTTSSTAVTSSRRLSEGSQVEPPMATATSSSSTARGTAAARPVSVEMLPPALPAFQQRTTDNNSNAASSVVGGALDFPSPTLEFTVGGGSSASQPPLHGGNRSLDSDEPLIALLSLQTNQLISIAPGDAHSASSPSALDIECPLLPVLLGSHSGGHQLQATASGVSTSSSTENSLYFPLLALDPATFRSTVLEKRRRVMEKYREDLLKAAQKQSQPARATPAPPPPHPQHEDHRQGRAGTLPSSSVPDPPSSGGTHSVDVVLLLASSSGSTSNALSTENRFEAPTAQRTPKPPSALPGEKRKSITVTSQTTTQGIPLLSSDSEEHRGGTASARPAVKQHFGGADRDDPEVVEEERPDNCPLDTSAFGSGVLFDKPPLPSPPVNINPRSSFTRATSTSTRHNSFGSFSLPRSAFANDIDFVTDALRRFCVTDDDEVDYVKGTWRPKK